MEGLNKFKEAFKQYADNYVIIGGTACEIVMNGTAVRPRATHDIDMIVVVERMTPEFGQRFWDFIKEGGYRPEKYKTTESEPVKYQLYRFVEGKLGYPAMIELLSRHPSVLGEPKGLVIEPIPIEDGVSSLIAIIMDDDFYNFTISHSEVSDGLRHADSAALIALKTKAYLNLLEMKAAGQRVNTKDIKKHRSDVLKIAVILEAASVNAPSPIVESVHEFIENLKGDWANVGPSLTQSLELDEDIISGVLDALDSTFIAE